MRTLIAAVVAAFVIAAALPVLAAGPQESDFTPDSLKRFPNGALRSGVLAKPLLIQDVKCVPGMYVEFDDKGRLAMLDDIPPGVLVYGVPCAIAWFGANEGMQKCLLAKNHKIDGKKYKKDEYVTFDAGMPKATYVPE